MTLQFEYGLPWDITIIGQYFSYDTLKYKSGELPIEEDIDIPNFALSADANTTLGIVFYSHKETPGLGAEVDKPWFQEQFKKDKNKRIFNNENNLVSIKLSRIVAEDDPHKVKGITGATVTTKGVTNLLKRDLDRYRLFLDSRKKK